MGLNLSKVRPLAGAVKDVKAPISPIPIQKPETQLLNNLNKLGQVNVDSPLSMQKTHQMTHTIRTQLASESATPSLTSIDAFGLSQLFDQRKGAKSPEHAKQMAIEFKLDPELVERLALRYTSPSIGRELVKTLSDGEQREYKEAIWVNASYK